MRKVDQSLMVMIRRRLTGDDPHSVKLQAITAGGFILASYLLFFVFTSGSPDVSEASGNLRADNKATTEAPGGTLASPAEEKPQGTVSSGIDTVTRIAKGISDDTARDQLVKFTEIEYLDFFDKLDEIGDRIKKNIESTSGSKACFELRYRAFAEVVTIIVHSDISVFTSNRDLAQKWQAVKDASVNVYRLSYFPVAANSTTMLLVRRGWYFELVKNIDVSDGLDSRYPCDQFRKAIAVARDRLFDQRLTVGEYEAVQAGVTFVRNIIRLTIEAHRTMDAFQDALASVAETNDVVARTISPKAFDTDRSMYSFNADVNLQLDYDLHKILGINEHAYNAAGRIDLLSNPPRYLPK